jgi:F0F1-type ATP synthase membrane subunit c/vacuolar-type H+-ATPase subunit K
MSALAERSIIDALAENNNIQWALLALTVLGELLAIFQLGCLMSQVSAVKRKLGGFSDPSF